MSGSLDLKLNDPWVSCDHTVSASHLGIWQDVGKGPSLYVSSQRRGWPQTVVFTRLSPAESGNISLHHSLHLPNQDTWSHSSWETQILNIRGDSGLLDKRQDSILPLNTGWHLHGWGQWFSSWGSRPPSVCWSWWAASQCMVLCGLAQHICHGLETYIGHTHTRHTYSCYKHFTLRCVQNIISHFVSSVNRKCTAFDGASPMRRVPKSSLFQTRAEHMKYPFLRKEGNRWRMWINVCAK